MPSSVVSQFQYDQSNRVLQIKFVSGRWYAYLNVPEKVFQKFKKARSKGQFLNTCIKGVYPFKKIKPKNE